MKELKYVLYPLLGLLFLIVFASGAWWLWDKIQQDAKPATQNATVTIIAPNVTSPIVIIIPGSVNTTSPNQSVPNMTVSPTTAPNITVTRPVPPDANVTSNITITPPFGIPVPPITIVYDPANFATGIVPASEHISSMSFLPKPADAIELGWGVMNIKDQPVSFSIKFLINDQPAGSLDNLRLGSGETYMYQTPRLPIGGASKVILKIIIVL